MADLLFSEWSLVLSSEPFPKVPSVLHVARSFFVKKNGSSLMAHLCRSCPCCSTSRTLGTFRGVTQLRISSSVIEPDFSGTGEHGFGAKYGTTGLIGKTS